MESINSTQIIGTFCNKCQNIVCLCKQKEDLEILKSKIKYNYDCKHYFGIVSAENEEEAKKILHKDHTGNGDKLCNWSKTTKKDCQINCKLNLKKK